MNAGTTNAGTTNAWIERNARRRAVCVLLLCLLLTAATVGLYPLDAEYWGPFFHGPTKVDAAMLAAQPGPEVKITTPFATVEGTRVLDSGVQEVTTEDGIYKHVTAGYYALLVTDAEGGHKALMVKSGKPPGTTVTGTLEPMPYDLEQTLFADDADGSGRSAVYPLLLDTESYRSNGYIAAGFGLVFLGIVWIFGVLAVRWLLDIRRHPAVKRAAAWGELGATAAAVQAQLKGGVRFKHRRYSFTDDYVVRQGWLNFDLLRLEELVWAYTKATKRSVNLIPMGTYYSAELHFADGTASIPASKAKVEAMIAGVTQRAPWAVIGFDKKIEELYSKHRAEFVAEVKKGAQAG